MSGRSNRVLAWTLIALAMATAIAAPATALPASEQPEAPGATTCELEPTTLRVRVDARAVEEPVLSPGLYWVPLPEALPRIPVCGTVAPGRERADEHSGSGGAAQGS